mmetsp:Transcript_29605/g.78382  ORF Transcript_29605/g.78382 Transcript_29605/m.78382 type:complete len:212 (+) Transcript_29605:487-1122(+)
MLKLFQIEITSNRFAWTVRPVIHARPTICLLFQLSAQVLDRPLGRCLRTQCSQQLLLGFLMRLSASFRGRLKLCGHLRKCVLVHSTHLQHLLFMARNLLQKPGLGLPRSQLHVVRLFFRLQSVLQFTVRSALRGNRHLVCPTQALNHLLLLQHISVSVPKLVRTLLTQFVQHRHLPRELARQHSVSRHVPALVMAFLNNWHSLRTPRLHKP